MYLGTSLRILSVLKTHTCMCAVTCLVFSVEGKFIYRYRTFTGIGKGDMKSVSSSIGVINVCVLVCQITPFTHRLGKFAAKARTSGEVTRKRDGLVTESWF